MDDDRRLLYPMTAGFAVSGLLFGSRFGMGAYSSGFALGLAACVLLWFRYRGPSYWNRLLRHGTRREIQQFKTFFIVFALAVKGLLR